LVVPPALCIGNAEVLLDGEPVAALTGTTNWLTNTLSFAAHGTSTALKLAGEGANSRTLVDTFLLSDLGGPDFVLAEESLDKVAGLDPFGDWRLEVTDTRLGATNPTPPLVQWQLSLIMENVTPPPVALLHHQPATNSVGPGQIRYFTVAVPSWASFATNTLV